MIEQARACLALLNRDLISEITGELDVVETAASGAGTVKLRYDGPAVKVKPRKDGKGHMFSALADLKCADGAFITFHKDGAKLHIVELKGGISSGSWPEIRKQFEGMFLVCLAVCRILQINHFSDVICYVAGTKDKIAKSQSASLILSKTTVGGTGTFGELEQWHAGRVSLPFGQEAKLVKGWRDAHGDHDFGPIAAET